MPSLANHTTVVPGDTRVNATESTQVTTPLCQTDLQSDGRISLLAQSFDSANNLMRYGYALDHVAGMPAAIALDRVPQTTTWSGVVEDRRKFSITARRKGVDYVFAPLIVGAAGTFSFPEAFPVDGYYLDYAARRSVTDLGYARFVTSMPATLALELPDYLLTEPVYDSAVAAFNWASAGTAPRDLHQIYFYRTRPPGSSQPGFSWSGTVSGDVTQWLVPQLPAPYNAMVDRHDLNNAQFWTQGELNVRDYQYLSGLRDVWLATLSGQTLETLFENQDVRRASRQFALAAGYWGVLATSRGLMMVAARD